MSEEKKSYRVWHRVVAHYERATVHRQAAREWRAIASAKSDPVERAYHNALAESQEHLMHANFHCAKIVEAATLALDGEQAVDETTQ